MKRPTAAIRIFSVLSLVVGFTAQGWLVAPAPVAAANTPSDWPMYLHDGQLTAASTETILTPAAAPNLRPLWTYKTGGVVSASATVVGGVAYVGSWDGYEYALNATTGALVWKTFIGTTTAPGCSPPQIGVSSVAAVVNGVAYVGGGDSNWYALDAATGSVLWTVPTGSTASGYYNWASPLIVGNSAYIGIASLGDCPLVQGQLLRIDLTTHAVVASVAFVPGGQVGGGIWTTPAIDPSTNTVYVTTGTLNQVTQTLSEAMVAVDATTLAIKSSWQIPRSAANQDSDWGNSPILFSDSNGRPMVAGINKNGFLYAFDRTNLALGPIWADQVAIGGICPTCGDASVSSMAFAQGLLFVAGGNTTIGGVGYPGAMRAIDPTTGSVVWARGLADPVIPAIAYDNGMVFAGSGPRLEVFDAATGNVLSSYSTGVVTYSPPSISNGTVFMGTGNGTVYAFAPVTPTAPPADAGCPSGLVCQDIGGPSPAGSETVSAGAWTITVGGAGIGLAAGTDQFRLMSQAVRGDVGITARIAAQTVVAAGTQSGVMVRQANDPGSPFYSVTYAGGNSILVQYRLIFGGATRSVKVAAGAAPLYLQIQRRGDSFNASLSTNGTTYTLVPGSSATVVMPTSVMAGLAAASGANGTSASSTIDSVVEGAPGPAPVPPASPSACPTGWSCVDVGTPASVGDQSLSSGTWTIKGAGTASGNNVYSDQMHLIWQPIAGDASLSARVATQQNTSAGAQAGLAFRANAVDPGAIFYGAFVTPTNGIAVVARTSEGLRTTLLAATSGAAPAYLEITRYQGTFTTFTSPNGATWTALSGSSLTFGGTGAMIAGLTVDSGSATTQATDTLDTVALTGSAAPPPSLCPAGWTCQDIGNPTPGTGSQYVVPPNWSVTAGGSDIWGTYDSFRLLSQPMATDGTMSVRVDSQVNTSTWAKAGAMIRATNDPGSAYYAAFVTPGNGIAVQWRATQGGSSAQVAISGVAPVWLEVARAAGTFTAYTSADGVTWTAVPGTSVALPMTGTLLAGLAVTAHNGGAIDTVTFDTPTLASTTPPPPNACPTGWTCADVGSTGVAGGQSLTSGTWIVQGAGGDIWGTADGFHYAWQTTSTDASLSARVVTQANSSVWAKSGLMFRASTDPGSPYYAAFVTPGSGIAVQWRSALAGPTSQVVVAGSSPVYLEIGRTGGVYSAYTSPDGVTWTLVPGSSVNVGLIGVTLAGFAVTSHNWGVLGSATFDTLRIAPLPPFWSDADVGSPTPAGSASATGGALTQTAGGSDIYGAADQMNFAYQPTSGDATFSARVVSQANTSAWTKAGVMLRSTTSAGSPYYAEFVTPGHGVAVQWRKTQGGATTQVVAAATAPLYLRVVRSGNTFSSYTSLDGTAWTLVPNSTVTFAFASAELAGLAATSHNTKALTTAVFDTISLAKSAPPPPNDFSISSKPSSLPMPQGTAGWSTISTAIVAGATETINLTVGGAPSGMTAALSPASVTTGGTSTLSIGVDASVPAGTYALVVTGTSPSATHTTKVTVTVSSAPAALPSPWQSSSIGLPAIPGSVSDSAGTFTVNAAGTDLYGTSDQLEFAYQSVSAVNTFGAHVASETNTSSWARAGLMVRATTDPASPYYGVFVTPGNGVVVQWRSAQGGKTAQVKVAGTAPTWLQIGVSGGVYTAYTSSDGVTWTAIAGSATTLSLPGPVLVGMAVDSHNLTAVCSATFDTVALT